MLHWSFPFEMPFYNYGEFVQFFSKTVAVRDEFYNKMINNLKVSTNWTDHIKTFLQVSSINQSNTMVKQYFKDFYEMITNTRGVSMSDYDEFIHKSSNTIDLYGVGIALMYVHTSMNIYMNNTYLKNELSDLYYSMINPNLYKRVQLDEAIQNYEVILEKSGLLKQYGKQFIDHELVDIPQIPLHTSLNINQLNTQTVSISPNDAKNVIQTILKKCPTNKEYNPNSKRCVKTCKSGYMRNDKFKCVKDQTKKANRTPTNINSILSSPSLKSPYSAISIAASKSKATSLITPSKTQSSISPSKAQSPIPSLNTPQSSRSSVPPLPPSVSISPPAMANQSFKVCPSDKEYNPITNRCVKKCRPNQHRNDKFKCVSNQTRKQRKP
jgi:hypothetical protein